MSTARTAKQSYNLVSCPANTMKIKFTKMHGAGNDFVVVDAIHQVISLTPEQWKFIANRRFGIGADQMLVVEKSQSPDVDFRYRIYNADGGEVEQCGNGARAFARFVSDKGLTSKRLIRVETMSGIIEPRLEGGCPCTGGHGRPDSDAQGVTFESAGVKRPP